MGKESGTLLKQIPNGHRPETFPESPPSLALCHARWDMGNLAYKMHSGQLAIRDTIREIDTSLISECVILCARRFGKSTLGVEMALEDCIQNPGVRVYYTGKTIEFAADLLGFHLKVIAADAPEGLITEYSSDRLYIIKTERGESELVISGFGTRSDTRLRGFPAHRIYVEESREFAPKSYLNVIKGSMEPMLADSDHGLIVHLTTPPDDPNHPFVTETVNSCIEGVNFFRKTIWDNPRFSHHRKLDIIAKAGGETSERCRREWFAEIVRDSSKVIIPTFDESRHKVSHTISKEKMSWMIWMDNGGVLDKTVAQLVVYDTDSDTCHLIDERYFETNTETRIKVESIKKMERHYTSVTPTRIVDVSGEVRVDLHKTHAFETVKPIKTKKDDRRQEVIDIFSENRITIHERCKFTLATLAYAKMNSSGKDFERTPQYGHADAIASIVDGWNSRFMGSAMAGVRRTLDTFVASNCEHRLSFVGISFENDEKPTFAIALAQTGKLLKSAAHRGDKESRLEFVAKFLADLKDPVLTFSTVSTGESFRMELRFLIPKIYEIELKGKIFEDMYCDLRDSIDNRTVDISEFSDLYRDYKVYKPKNETSSEVVESLMLANHSLAQWRKIRTYLAKGNMLKPDKIQYYQSFEADSLSAGIWFDSSKFTYSLAVKAYVDKKFMWVHAASSLRTVGEALDRLKKLKVSTGKIACPSDMKDELETALIHRDRYLDIRIFSVDFKPGRQNVIQSFDEELEVVDLMGSLLPVVEQALTYPADICAADLLYAGALCNFAAVRV